MSPSESWQRLVVNQETEQLHDTYQASHGKAIFWQAVFPLFPNRKEHNEYITFLTYAYNIPWVFCGQFLGQFVESDEQKTDWFLCILSSWWFQPIWKILVKLDHFRVGMKTNNIWNHHLVSWSLFSLQPWEISGYIKDGVVACSTWK